ncbi:MAG TPA: hypothetical protein VEU55_01830 [Gemmatimonadales bacterium]|nr:hypothetical protein [Gemmatimonadales bacterium]
MFIGHYALGLAAKRLVPRTSLGTLFVAPQLADLLWPMLLLTGWERVRVVPGPNAFLRLVFDAFPISHSLLALCAWGAMYGLLYAWRTGYQRGAVVVALLVVSHWVLDFVSHVPDMPLYPGGPRVGLGLWHSVAGTVTTEGLMFVIGMGVYLGTTRARDAWGRYGIWALGAVLALCYAASLVAPPPPSLGALAIGGIVFGWLFVAWAAWVDRHREAPAASASAAVPPPR